MISVAVCDDEPQVAEYLKNAVGDYFARADLDGRVTVFSDGEPLAQAYASGEADFDIILLDITMKNCDGLTAAKRIREKDADVMIVFVTASAEYVFRGYEVRDIPITLWAAEEDDQDNDTNPSKDANTNKDGKDKDNKKRKGV